MKRFGLVAIFLFLPTLALAAEKPPDEVEKSTTPIGSPFFRHLAYDLDLDLKQLVKLEKRGFGRAETITLALLSKMTDTALIDLGKRRISEKTTLKTLTEEAGLEYVTLYKTVQAIKKAIEAKGEDHLPPPVFADDKSDTDKDKEPEEKKKEKEGRN